MAYVELHCHSAFSFLDGASLPDELVAAALELGHTTLALTDHDSVSGAMEFAQSARSLGLRAIHGAEVTVTDDHGIRHLTLLVRDATGWRSLCRLLTRAHAHTRDGSTDASRRNARPPSVTLEDVEAHTDGLLCLSGCATHGVRDEPTMRRLVRAFGREHVRVELQRPFARYDRARNRGLAALAGRLGVRCVATGNVHAHAPSRAQLQDALVARSTPPSTPRPLRRGNHAHVLSAPAAMAARFADHPDAVAETARIAELCTFDLTQDLGYRYPGRRTAPTRAGGICDARFDERYPVGHGLRERHGRLGRSCS